MTEQLSKAELDRLKADLARYGLTVVKAKVKSTKAYTNIKAWKPETQAGRKCKSNMLMYQKLGPVVGIKDYAVRNSDNNWVHHNEPGFDRAVEYQRLVTENWAFIKGC